MIRTISYTIRPDDAGKSIREFLREEGYSRHILASIKPIAEAVQVNGIHAPLYATLQENDHLQIRVEDPVSSETIVPAPVPFTIVYEDEDLLVIDKPTGVSIHPAPGHPADTLANGLAYYYEQQGIPFVFRGINRLDRDTTGLLLVAKNLVSASILETALQAHEIRRTYLALVEGELTGPGTVDLPIARKPGSLIERCIDESGDRAVTHFQRLDYTLASQNGVVCCDQRLAPANAVATHNPVLGRSRSELERSGTNLTSFGKCRRSRQPLDGDMCYGIEAGNLPFFTPLELRLETGRTHQIRVHMAAIGHPLLGDSLYNPRWMALFEKGVPKEGVVFPYGLKRQALHSRELAFTHPITKEPMRFTAPVPEDLLSILIAFAEA